MNWLSRFYFWLCRHDIAAIRRQTHILDVSTRRLHRAIHAVQPFTPLMSYVPPEKRIMNPAQQAIADLTNQTAATATIMESAVNCLLGVHSIVDAAVAEALKNGATAEQLAPITEATAALKAQSQKLADAITSVTNPTA